MLRRLQAAAAAAPVQGRVDKASRELKEFVASQEGQDLIQTMFLVFEDVQKLASVCRNRHRGHGFFKAAAGAAAVTGGVIVIVAGTIMSGGTALPAEIAAATAFFAGGTITLASAAAVSIANTLTSLGFDKHSANTASKRMTALTELMKPWDTKFDNLLQAGGTLDSISASVEAVSDSIAGKSKASGVHSTATEQAFSVGMSAHGAYGVVQSGVAAKDAILLQKVMTSFLDIGLDGYVAGGAAVGGVAPKAVFGLAKAGSSGARGLFFGLSGVGIAFSLCDIVSGLSSMFSGQSEAADCLDAHLDKLCLLLHIILIAGRGTPAADQILKDQDLHKLLIVKIRSCAVCAPSYRFGDLSKKVLRSLSGSKPPEHDVYFTISVGNRNRQTDALRLPEQCDAVDIASPQVIITRVLPGDSRLSLQMCAKRGLGHRLTVGDSSMSKTISLELPEASEFPTRMPPCDDRTELEFEFQTLDPPQPSRS